MKTRLIFCIYLVLGMAFMFGRTEGTGKESAIRSAILLFHLGNPDGAGSKAV